MNQQIPVLALALLALSSMAASSALAEGYYRDPDVHGDRIVFVAEGDLWTVPVTGGDARRLTSHLDEERFPQIHPDGETVAFSASYEGAQEVYTMPLSGGAPERWTWEADASRVVGWSSREGLVYSTTALSTLPSPLLVEIDRVAERRARLPLFEASDAAFAEDGTVFFARPEWHRNNTKRYQGGTARNLWRWTPGGADDEAVNLTADFDGENFAPMWWGGRLYYLNDRDGTMNVWSMSASGDDPRQHTRHSGWDVKGPSVGPLTDGGAAIVYQLGADLWLLDLTDDTTRKVEVRLTTDYDQLRDRWVDDLFEDADAVDPSPNGDRVVVTSRGRVFVLPSRFGRQVQIAPREGVRYRSARFLPDGERVLLLSDETGEQEFYVAAADGTGEVRQVTDDSTMLNFGGIPSPDGSKFAATDRGRSLWLIDLESGARRRINDIEEGVGDVAWSPDSRWLVWERGAPNTYTELRLTDTEAADGDAAFSPGVRLTSDRVNSFSATFSPDGDWLFFLSDRNLVSLVGSPWGPRQPEPYFDASMKVYQLGLRRGLRPTFRIPDETMEVEKRGKDDEDGKGDGEDDSADDAVDVPAIQIDLDGIADRVWALPIEPGNYGGLATNGEALFLSARASGPSPSTRLVATALDVEALEGDAAKLETVADDIFGFQLSGDGKKVLVRQRGALHVVPAKVAKADLGKTRVPTANFRFAISQREDYRQLFLDAWRLERDYFYDPNMHGVDWDGVRDKYLPLVDRVTTRAELSDLIGEVVGELSALHISVRGGDERDAPDQIAVPTLGARFGKDEQTGGFVVDHIYRTDPDMPDWRGPLADPYLDVEAGDVILAVNGRDAASARQMGELLRGQAGRQVLIDLHDASSGDRRRIVVVPTTNERELRYQDWELERRLRTDDLGDGKIGYVHLRAMGSGNLSEWYRNFYPVADRQGLIIDARHNRGGNIDSIILEKLLRQAWFYWAPRNGQPYWNMQYAFRGHMVVLVNAQTASDGEAFAEGFRRLGLGKVIGMRTWGGEIWLSNNNRLSDGGIARAPQTGVYADGEWLIEGWGVVPDIEVDNLPRETFDGRDRQLETAVQVLLEAIEEDPREVPAPPPYPDKSFEYPQPEG